MRARVDNAPWCWRRYGGVLAIQREGMSCNHEGKKRRWRQHEFELGSEGVEVTEVGQCLVVVGVGRRCSHEGKKRRWR